MTDEKTNLEGLLSYLKNDPEFTMQLFLITRHLKDGMRRYTKKVDKYKYKTSKVEFEKEIKDFFINLFKNKLEYRLSDDDVSIEEYDIITDDLDNTIYTYTLNTNLDFADVIIDQINAGTNIPAVTSLENVEDNLWAYGVKVDFIHNSNNFIFFRKMNRGKIATAEENMLERLKCNFSTNESHLEVVKKDMINFDDKIDCFYMNDQFYIFKKNTFENMLGLEEEYKANAEEIIEDLEMNDVIDGMDIFQEKVKSSKRLLKKMANISRSGNHKNIDSQRIENMKGITHRLDLELEFTEDDKIKVENKKDAKILVKMLDKYYLECMQTHELYGSFAKKSLAE